MTSCNIKKYNNNTAIYPKPRLGMPTSESLISHAGGHFLEFNNRLPIIIILSDAAKDHFTDVLAIIIFFQFKVALATLAANEKSIAY